MNKSGFATVDTNCYSLCPALFGETIQAKLFFAPIEFCHGRRLIAQFRRCCLIAKKEYRPDPLVLHGPPVVNYTPNLTASASPMGGDVHD